MAAIQAGDVSGDAALARALEAFRKNGVAVDSRKYVQVDERPSWLAALAHAWEWVVHTALSFGVALKKQTVIPLARLFEKRVLSDLRQKGELPVGLHYPEKTSAQGALLQMVMRSSALQEVFSGFGSLLFAFQKCPEFEKAVRTALDPEQMQPKGKRSGSEAVAEVQKAYLGVPTTCTERGLMDALQRGISLLEALKMAPVQKALSQFEVQRKVAIHFAAFLEYQLFQEEYTRAQGEGGVSFAPLLSRFFEHIEAGQSFRASEVGDLFIRVMKGSPIPSQGAGMLEKEHLYHPTDVQSKEQCALSYRLRTLFAPLKQRLDGAHTLEALLIEYALPPHALQPLYILSHEKEVEFREVLHTRCFSAAPKALFLPIERPPHAAEIEVPLKEMQLPHQLCREAARYRLEAFVAPKGKQAALYVCVPDQGWIEIAGAVVAFIKEKEAKILLASRATLLHYRKSGL